MNKNEQKNMATPHPFDWELGANSVVGALEARYFYSLKVFLTCRVRPL